MSDLSGRICRIAISRAASPEGHAPRQRLRGIAQAAVLAAVLTEDPTEPGAQVDGVPADLDRAIMRCLRKDPERRWQTMADLKVALQDIKDALGSGSWSPAIGTGTARSRLRRWWLVGAAAGLAIVAGAAGVTWWWLGRPAPCVTGVVERLTFESGAALSPSISPDGNLLA